MRIKTKYNIGDTIIYYGDGLKIATITSFKIRYSLGDIYIDYELQGFKNNYKTKFELNECRIISKATKKLVKKQITSQHEDKGE